MRSPMNAMTPIFKDIVLIGGGHAHVTVLRRWGMRPIAGVRLTLITRDLQTPYSGMLPGLVAGHYHADHCHIDLGPLSRFASARLIHAEVSALDPDNQQVLLPGRPPIAYDVLSINIGSRPRAVEIPGAAQFAMPIKPIDRWLRDWAALQHRVMTARGAFRLAVVGAGAGGVELMLAMRHRLLRRMQAAGKRDLSLHCLLLTASDEVLPGHGAGAQRRLRRILAERDVAVHTGRSVVEVADGAMVTADGTRWATDATMWVVNAAAAAWPRAAGLAVDDQGFIRVDAALRSISHATVFAAGDIAALPTPRPKSGVFAVRQGAVLAENLRRAVLSRPLRRYRPQRAALGLIGVGDRYAVASRGRWSLEGRWLWWVKDWLDRRFIRRFSALPAMAMAAAPPVPEAFAQTAAARTLQAAPLRCGGCAAKVSGTVLARVLDSLPKRTADNVLLGLDASDDAVVLQPPPGKVLVQSVDYFRAFTDDAYLAGRISANHALGDLYAMGADAQSALAIVTLPFADEGRIERTLRDVLMGALVELERAGAVLAGGHSSEGAEFAFGLSVNGWVEARAMLRKGGMRPGDALLLTKPLGTGVLLAAHMQGRAKGDWLSAAWTAMLQSNREAVAVLRRHGVTACTDVTGFGLAGHALEMLRRAELGATLYLDSIPVLDGVAAALAAGVVSSLHGENARLSGAVRAAAPVERQALYPVLFDPQTAGGLLATVPPADAAACIQALRRLGYAAAHIGSVHALTDTDTGGLLRVR